MLSSRSVHAAEVHDLVLNVIFAVRTRLSSGKRCVSLAAVGGGGGGRSDTVQSATGEDDHGGNEHICMWRRVLGVLIAGTVSSPFLFQVPCMGVA